MAVNLYKHRDQLLTTYKQVTDDNNPTQWAIYGYNKDTNDLEVVTTGKELGDLVDELDSCKILYAFARVVDPNTGLNKYVQINWQGEGASLSRKGICANHIKDVNGFFRGAHVTINARSEDEVEPSVILEKVAKASSTKLNLKDRSDIVENTGPVGSNYQRVQAAREINSSERESFWTTQQEEERKRKIDERKRLEEDRKKAGEEEKKREVEQAKEREVIAVKKDQEIAKRRELEKNAENRARDLMDVRRLSSSGDDTEGDPEEERTRRSEEARKQRALEARKLIDGSRIKDARALFEKHSSAPVVPVKKPGLVAKAINRFNGTTQVVKKPVESSSFAARKDAFEPSSKPQEVVPPTNHVKNTKKMFEQTVDKSSSSAPSTASSAAPSKLDMNGQSNGTAKVTAPPATSHSVPIEKTTKPDVIPVVDEVKAPSPAATPSIPESNSDAEEEQVVSPIPDHVDETLDDDDNDYIVHEEVQAPRRLSGYDLQGGDHVLEDIAEEPEEDEHGDHNEHGKQSAHHPPASSSTGPGIKARALYDYQAADETEISFDPEDIITHVDMIDPGWYQGMAPDGSYGLFPANYVEIIQE